MTRLKAQIEQLYHQLDRELESFPAGSRFHSVREIMYRYSVHRGVVDGALLRLSEAGVIRRIPCVGIYSNITRAPQMRRVLLAFPDWPGTLMATWAQKAMQYAETHENWQLRRILVSPAKDNLDVLEKEHCDGVIVFFWRARLEREDMLFLSKLQTPAIFLSVYEGSFAINTVRSDNRNGITELCRYWHRQGHRRLLLVVSEPRCAIAENVDHFKQISSLLGIDVIDLDCHTRNGEYSRTRAYETVKAYLAAHNGKIDFTACHVFSGESVAGVMAAFREYNFNIPEDISITTQAGSDDGLFSHPPLTVLATDIEGEVRAAFENMAALLSRRTSLVNVQIPMRVIERDSVRPLTPNPGGIAK